MSEEQDAIAQPEPEPSPEPLAEQLARRPSLLTLPNVLTAMRLVLLPVIVAGITTHHHKLAVIAMALAILTDLADGRLARRLSGATPFGKSLDGTVDFVLIYSLFISLYVAGYLVTWQFAVLYAQMLSILLLQIVIAGTGSGEEAGHTPLGKPVGALQYLFLLFLIAMLVLPRTPVIDAIEFYYFIVLTAAIAVNTFECLRRLRRMV